MNEIRTKMCTVPRMDALTGTENAVCIASIRIYDWETRSNVWKHESVNVGCMDKYQGKPNKTSGKRATHRISIKDSITQPEGPNIRGMSWNTLSK